MLLGCSDYTGRACEYFALEKAGCQLDAIGVSPTQVDSLFSFQIASWVSKIMGDIS